MVETAPRQVKKSIVRQMIEGELSQRVTLQQAMIDDATEMIDSISPKGLELVESFTLQHEAGTVLTERQIETLYGIAYDGWYDDKGAGTLGYVYAIDDGLDHIRDGSTMYRIKIGFSQDPKRRLNDMKTSLPRASLAFSTETYSSIERLIHQDIKGHPFPSLYHDIREWFWSSNEMGYARVRSYVEGACSKYRELVDRNSGDSCGALFEQSVIEMVWM